MKNKMLIMLERFDESVFLWVDPNTDFDIPFVGICEETGDQIRVNEPWNLMIARVNHRDSLNGNTLTNCELIN